MAGIRKRDCSGWNGPLAACASSVCCGSFVALIAAATITKKNSSINTVRYSRMAYIKDDDLILREILDGVEVDP